MMPIAVLDFDKTITSTDTIKIWLLAYIICFPASAFKMAFCLIRNIKSSEKITVKEKIMKIAYEGRSAEQISRVDKMFSIFLRIFRIRRQSVLDYINDYIRDGYRVLIVTASAQNSVSEAMSDFIVDIIGTKFLMNENRFTGEVESSYCFGEEKVARLRQYIKSNSLSVRDLKVAWSDSLSDLPVMRLARNRIWPSTRRDD